MPKPWEVPPEEVHDWRESDYLMGIAEDFARDAARRCELKEIQSEIDEELKELNARLGGMIATTGFKSVVFGDYRITLSNSTKGGRLSKERLLELGVSAETIALATSPKEIGDAFITVYSNWEKDKKGKGSRR